MWPAQAEPDQAKRARQRLHRELMDFNPSAARSLAEGMEETITVRKRQIPPLRRQTLASTNVMESALSVVERVCANMKRWHPGDQRERWVGSGLIVAQNKFRRVKGYQQIPLLVKQLQALTPARKEVVTTEESLINWVTGESLLSTEIRAISRRMIRVINRDGQWVAGPIGAQCEP